MPVTLPGPTSVNGSSSHPSSLVFSWSSFIGAHPTMLRLPTSTIYGPLPYDSRYQLASSTLRLGWTIQPAEHVRTTRPGRVHRLGRTLHVQERRTRVLVR